MSDRLHVYRGSALNVMYDKNRCIHAASCIRSLPRAFDPGSRPWVMPDNGSVEAVVRAVEACPTGALTYERLDGGPAEAPSAENAALVSRNGPVYFRGQLTLETPDGPRTEQRVALCRCGASARKPLCDGSHHRVRFLDSGAVPPSNVPSNGPEPVGPIELTPEDGGPMLAVGDFALLDGSGRKVGTMSGAALCRCGQSGSKPFCDGSHLAT